MIKNKKPIFIYKKPFAFAWSGGRMLIIKYGVITYFGDKGMGKGLYGNSASFKHDFLGPIKCNDTVFKFLDENVEFDFHDLKNCHFMRLNKAKNKKRFESAEIYHLKRFYKKHYND